MHQNYIRLLTLAGVLAAVAAAPARPADEQIPFPNGFRNWFAVNSMVVTQESPAFTQIGGMHIVYLNAPGLSTLKAGGKFPYPDGSVFADDVHEFTKQDGAVAEGKRKAVAVMVKNSKRYPTAGGWGFQVWAEGDPSKPLVPDSTHAVSACFTCHTSRAAQDYTFSTYIP